MILSAAGVAGVMGWRRYAGRSSPAFARAEAAYREGRLDEAETVTPFTRAAANADVDRSLPARPGRRGLEARRAGTGRAGGDTRRSSPGPAGEAQNRARSKFAWGVPGRPRPRSSLPSSCCPARSSLIKSLFIFTIFSIARPSLTRSCSLFSNSTNSTFKSYCTGPRRAIPTGNPAGDLPALRNLSRPILSIDGRDSHSSTPTID